MRVVFFRFSHNLYKHLLYSLSRLLTADMRDDRPQHVKEDHDTWPSLSPLRDVLIEGIEGSREC